VRRGEKEIRDRTEIDAIIRAARVLRLGLADEEEPYVVPLSFGYDGKSFYFHGAPEGRKIELIRRNSRVCFEIDELEEIVEAADSCGWAARYRSVIGVGRASILEDRESKRRGLGLVMAQYSSREHSFPDRTVDRTCVVRVDVLSISGKRSPP